MRRFTKKLAYIASFIFFFAVLAIRLGVLPTPILFAQTSAFDKECSDLIDNDGDGLIDYPADPDCSDEFDDSEADGTGPVQVDFTFLSPVSETVAGQVLLSAMVDGLVPQTVKFEISGKNINYFPAFFDGSAWNYIWDTTGNINQTYQITIIAIDTVLGLFESNPIFVDVFNPSNDLVIEINKPDDGAVIIDNVNVALEAEVTQGSPTKLDFKLFHDESLIDVFVATLSNGKWLASFDSNNYDNDNYTVIAKGEVVGGEVFESPPINIYIANSTMTEPLSIIIVDPDYGDTISGTEFFKAETSRQVDSLSFVLFNGMIDIPIGSADQITSSSWGIFYNTNNVSDGSYVLLAEAIVNNPPAFASSQINLTIQNIIPGTAKACSDDIDNDGDGFVDLDDPGCDSSKDDDEFNEPAIEPPPPEPDTQCSDGFDNDGDGLVDLNDPGCDSSEDDDEFNEPSIEPPPPEPEPEPVTQCSDGIDNDGDGYIDLIDFGCDSPEDDDEFYEPAVVPPPPEPDTTTVEPEPNRLDPEIAEACIISGIVDFEACNRFLFEIYDQPIADQPEHLLPVECLEVEIIDQEQCDQFLKNTFMPDECRQASISSVDDCDIYLAGLHLSPECLVAKIFDNHQCDQFLNERYLDVECSLAGKTDAEACQDHILETYAIDVSCDGLDDVTCNRALRERHLNDLISGQKSIEAIEAVISPYLKQSVTLKPVPEDETEVRLENFVPIVIDKDVTITLLPSVSQVLLNEQDEIVQTASAIIIFDSDGDGVPNEIERRLGTNPFSADSDNDGIDDGDELRRNLNPSGSGELPFSLAPSEQALINQETIEQPKVSGKISRLLLVEKVEDIIFDEQGITVQKFSGSAFPNSLVTLYIYSDLPLVVTVNVDKFGNWEYTLRQSLLDGKHEVYVTVNDNTGKIIAKSNPLSFLIDEAKAVSPEEFIAAQRSARSSGISQQILIYLLLVLIFTIGGIALFVYFIKFRKSSFKNENTGGLIDGGAE